MSSKLPTLIKMADPLEALKATKPVFTSCIIDADSLIYQIAWTTPNKLEATRSFDRTILDLMERADVQEATVLVKGDSNFRYFIDPFYKVKRREHDYTTPDVKERTAHLLAYVQDIYGKCEDGGEADDWCAILMKEAIARGEQPVLCHIDKDLNMIPGWHYHIKLKDYYHQNEAQAFYFMMKQLIIGDMSADSIPGLNKIGEVKAAEKFRSLNLSQLKQKVIHLWQTNSHGIQQNDPDTSYRTNKEKIQRMFDSANCLILRDDRETLRKLSRQEILDIMTWDKKDVHIDSKLEIIRLGVYSLNPASYTAGEVSKKDKERPRERQVDIRADIEAGRRPPTETLAWYKEAYSRKVRYKTSVPDSRIKAQRGYNPADTLKKRGQVATHKTPQSKRPSVV